MLTTHIQVVTDDSIEMKFSEILVKKKTSTKTNDNVKEKRVKRVCFPFYYLVVIWLTFMYFSSLNVELNFSETISPESSKFSKLIRPYNSVSASYHFARKYEKGLLHKRIRNTHLVMLLKVSAQILRACARAG